jgi:hypothetical protein
MIMRVEESISDGINVYTTIYEESDFATSEQKQNWLSACDTCEFKRSDTCGNYAMFLDEFGSPARIVDPAV